MKKIYLILLLWLSFSLTFAQKDSTFHQHLLIKLAPITYVGMFPAIQIGLETNADATNTLAFDYAYGNYAIAVGKTGNGFIEGESSHRFRFEYRWYRRPFAEEDISRNTF